MPNGAQLSNGLSPFAFHRHDDAATAEALRPSVGAADGPKGPALQVGELSSETAARRYLAVAFASSRLPGFEAVEVDGRPSELVTLGTEAVPLTGTWMVKFRQVSRNVPVYGSLVTVELDEDNELLSISSALGNPSGVDPIARLSPSDATEVVSRHAGVPPEALPAAPRLHFYFDAKARRWRLVYIAENVPKRSAAKGPWEAISDFVVDAHGGELVAELPRTQRQMLDVAAGGPVVDEAMDGAGVVRRFCYRRVGEAKHLVDGDHNVHTFDFDYRDLARPEHYAALPGRYVALPPSPWNPGGVSAHANAVEVARFLREVLKRDGLDDKGGAVVSSINCRWGDDGDGKEWHNAAWIGTQMVYGQRDVDGELRSYAVALDVVAHEIVHGLTDHTARLEYEGMTGALNESYSDIFGVLVSNRGEPDREAWNWEMGEALDDSGLPIRDMRDPTRCGQPAHMRDYRVLPHDRWHDEGGVHINSGIHNKAAYLLLTKRDPSGRYVFDVDSVAALFYIALTQHLSRTSLFGDSRRGVELAARSLFRRDESLDAKLAAIEECFDAVGISQDLAPPEVTAPAAAPEALEALVRSAPALVIPYDPEFLGGGFEVPLPGLTARARAESFEGGRVLDYVHFSLVMNQRRRTALFTACNVDASSMVRLGRSGLPWMLDVRLPEAAQLGPRYYAGNAWDRGHLVRRQDPLWGSVRVARDANAATFYYTNAAPQHENFNQDEWLVLEDWVLEHATDFAYRLCVFTGPVLLEDDPPLDDAQVPAGFFKVVVLRDATAEGEDLSAVAFFMKQHEMSRDKLGRELLVLERYQIRIAAIEAWTGLDFGALKYADELEWAPASLRAAEPDTVGRGYRPIHGPEDIVWSGTARRAIGARVAPTRPIGEGPPPFADRFAH